MYRAENINDISTIIIEYIKSNKEKYNIDYEDTIEAIKEVIEDIEKDFKEIGDAEDE